MSRSFYFMLHSRFGQPLSAPERLARIEEKLRAERSQWQLPTIAASCVNSVKNRPVAIVGGGFAGLLAARDLCRLGFKVHVYEAHKEVGGRVRSNKTFSPGRITEEGAELIGSIHPMWRELAIEYGIAWISRMDGGLYAREGLHLRVLFDRILTTDELKKLYDLMVVVLKAIGVDAKLVGNPARPWLETKNKKQLEKFDNMSVADKLKKLAVKESSLLWKSMELLLRHDNVAPLDELNYLGLLCLVKGGQFGKDDKHLMGYWDELENFRCADGCQQLALELAAEIQKKKPRCEVFVNKMVKAIDISKANVVLTWVDVIDGKPGAGPGQNEQFDFVILAIPPTVWGAVEIKPKYQIGEIGMGHAVKFFSDVTDRFWVKKRMAPYGGSLKMGQVWEGTDNQTRIPGQGIVLSVFTGSRAPARKEFTDGLKELFPGYDPTPVTGNVRNTLYADWSSAIDYRFVQTGYASPKKGQIFKIGGELIKPFQDRMFFAGEHTQMDSFGYMEGSLRSGARAAGQLLKQACILPPSPKVQTAGVPPVRRKTASEQESEERANEAESPFLDRKLFAAEVTAEWESTAAEPLGESPFQNAFEQDSIEPDAAENEDPNEEFEDEPTGEELSDSVDFEEEAGEDETGEEEDATDFEGDLDHEDLDREDLEPMEFQVPPPSTSPTLGFEFDLNFGFESEVTTAKTLSPPAGFKWPSEGLKVTDHEEKTIGGDLKDAFVVTLDAVRTEISTVPFHIDDDAAFNTVVENVKKFGQELIDAKKTLEKGVAVPGVAGHPVTFSHPRTVVNKPEADVGGNLAFPGDRGHAGYRLHAVPLVIHRVSRRYPVGTGLWSAPQATVTLPLAEFGKLIWEIHKTMGGAPGEAFTGRAGDRLGVRDDLAWLALTLAVADRKKKIGTALSDGTQVTETDFTRNITSVVTILLMYMLTSVKTDPRDQARETFAKGSLPLNVKTPLWQIHKFALTDREKLVLHELYTDSGKRKFLFALASGKTGGVGKTKLFPIYTHGDAPRFVGTAPTWDTLVDALAKEVPVKVTVENDIEKKGHLKGNEILIAPLSSKIDWDKTKPRIAIEMRRIGFDAVGFAKWPGLMKRILELARKVNP